MEAQRTGGMAAWMVTLTAVAVSLTLLFLARPTIFEAIDFVHLHGLYRQYAREALLAGRLPLWNPHVNLGRPFLADMEAANFYPPNLLFVLLPAGPALAAVLALHLALALAGTRALGRYLGMSAVASAVAALAFAAGNVVTSRLMVGQLHFAEGITYLPLLLLSTARLQDGFSFRRLAMLAAAMALQLLSGHPQIAWVSWFGLAAFLAGRRLPAPPSVLARRLLADAAAFGAALVAALGLAAVQLLPFAELVRQSHRVAATPQFAAIGALPLRGASTLLLPPGPGRFVSWEYNLFCGSLIAVAGAAGMLALRDRNVRGLALGAGLAGLLALGERTPAFALAYRLVPGLASFRLHSRLAIWSCFALCVAAGLHLTAAAAAGRVRTRRTIGAAALAACAVAASLGARCQLASAPLRLALGVAAGVALLALWKAVPAWPVSLAVTVALAADLLSAGSDLRRIYWGEPWYENPRGREAAVVDQLSRAGLLGAGLPPPRTSLPKILARPNAGMRYGFSTYSGYAGLSPARAFEYLHRRLDLPTPEGATFPAVDIAARGPFPYDSMNLVLGFDPTSDELRLRSDPDPRAFLAFRTLKVSSWSEALERVRTGHDEARVALVEDPALELGPDTASSVVGAAPEAAQVVHFAPEDVRVRVDSPRPAVLVLKEAWYPGWTARIDGVPVPCHPANVWARAVRVPAGRHEVQFVYRLRWLGAGALVSVLSAVGLLTLCRVARPVRRNAPEASASEA